MSTAQASHHRQADAVTRDTLVDSLSIDSATGLNHGHPVCITQNTQVEMPHRAIQSTNKVSAAVHTFLVGAWPLKASIAHTPAANASTAPMEKTTTPPSDSQRVAPGNIPVAARLDMPRTAAPIDATPAATRRFIEALSLAGVPR
jgi:hypothetical protein